MVIKRASTSVDFSLQSIQLYDWGYANVITIQTYNNGILVGSVDFTPDPDWYAVTVSQADLLTPAYFNNIDEIRFFPKAPNTIFNLSMNNISLGGTSLSANADLSGLTLSSGTLSPAFAASTTSYAASVGNATTSVTVTPTVSDATATVTVNGTAVTSGNASGSISLNVGANTITTVVTAQDGTTASTYIITVSRLTVLPVTFTSIKAREQNHKIAIEWHVENETGIQKYNIERSSDGNAFSRIAYKNITSGYGNAATYKWLDENPLTGNNFYRIKSIGIDGKVEYSQIIKVFLGNTKPTLVIYPNPATEGIIHLQMNNMPVGIYKIQLINSTGQVIMVKTIKHFADHSNQKLIFSGIPKGVYVLKVNHPDGSTSSTTIIY